MADSSTQTIELRVFDSIAIEFYKNNRQSVDDFGKFLPLSFHFEEGISHPYTGTLTIVTKKAINLATLDLDYLYVKIKYSVKTVGTPSKTESRVVWALVKTITNLSMVEKVNSSDSTDKYYYQYLLTLESPLARLQNTDTFYKNYKISDIIKELLSRNEQIADDDSTTTTEESNTAEGISQESTAESESSSSTSLYNPLLNEVNVSQIEELSALDASKLEIQRGQEDALTFFNRLLIGYGINYIFDFDENLGVRLIFSVNQNYKSDNTLNCTDDESLAKNDTDYVFFKNNSIERNSVSFEQAKNIAKNLKSSWINIEGDRTDTSGTKASHIKNIYKNLCIRKLAVNPRLTSQHVQDLRVQPGLILNTKIHELTSRYVVRNVISNLTTEYSGNSKNNVILLKAECLELAQEIKFDFITDKDSGDYFEFDPKNELGCLANQSLNAIAASVKKSKSTILDIDGDDTISTLDPKQNINLLEAKACAKDGSINSSKYADYADDSGENNDLFYAVLINNDNSLIKVHSLIDGDSGKANKIMRL